MSRVYFQCENGHPAYSHQFPGICSQCRRPIEVRKRPRKDTHADALKEYQRKHRS